MKTIVITSALFLFLTTPQVFGFARTTTSPLYQQNSISNPCEDNHSNKKLTCIKINDDTYNVTFDCHQNGLQRAEVKFQYPDFPKHMDHLTIQNCETLILNLNCEYPTNFTKEENSTMINFSHLHIVNIGNFHLSENNLFLPGFERIGTNIYFRSYDDNSENEETSEENKLYLNDLIVDKLTSVTLENIELVELDHAKIPSSLFRCEKSENDALEQLKMININELHFGGFSEEHSTSLQEFLMDNVTVLPTTRDDVPLKINNTKAVVKITNSNLSKMNKIFKGSVSKLIVERNKIEELQSESCSYETDEFIFSGNVITSKAESFSLKGTSQITKVTDNIIHEVNDGAFSKLQQPDYNFNFDSIKKIYNFSNNKIQIIHAGDTVGFPHQSYSFHYDDIIISNNSVNCSCQNVFWFTQMAEKEFITHYGYTFWIKKENQNKCLNIPDCPLAQVMINYHNLCDTDYQCPKNVSTITSSTNFLMHIEQLLGNRLHANRVNSDSNSKILQVLIGNNHDSASVLIINTLCLIILLLLVCIIFGYLIVIKYCKVRSSDFRANTLGSVNTEMNSQTFVI